ncbi:sulfotransferase family 2 domain-containing protein [Paenibacillus sp. NPDC058071]|uniref:sulfotransferase family 2 domain-containing protein n=1 Tax=Paenibacillus sp. NPDC058071 TaxID=3346326 RepID=UPI0036DF5640
MDTDPLLLFMHIPKTGGTSFTQSLLSNYPRLVQYYEVGNNLTLLEYCLEKADAFSGHFPFGYHLLTKRPCTYVTILRDPVEQIVSWFYFKYKNPSYPEAYNIGLTLETYLREPAFDSEYVNLQTRLVSGEIDVLFPNLSLAMANLDRYFSFVGITELYEESLFLLSKRMGWKLKHYKKLNTTPNRPRKSEVSEEAIRLIRQKNELDIELYSYACRILNETITAMSPSEEQELLRYKRREKKWMAFLQRKGQSKPSSE